MYWVGFILSTVTLVAITVRFNQLNIELDTKTQQTKNVGIELKRQQLDKEVQTQKQQEEIQKQIDDLKAKVEAKKAEEARIAALPPTTSPIAPTAQASSDPSDAKMFIYFHESGNNPSSVNGSGCRGLGQACPGSKLPCGADYACQDAYFTSYMQGRYGSWENAKAFWLSHNWW